jgi:hypothetical protein
VWHRLFVLHQRTSLAAATHTFVSTDTIVS